MPKRNASARGKKNLRRRKIEYKKYLFILAIFFLSLGFLSIYSFFRHFSKACTFADSGDGGDGMEIQSSAAYSVALVTIKEDLKSVSPKIDTLRILYIKPNSSGSFFLDIPTDYVFDMPGRFGEEEVSSILALGMLDSVDGASYCSDACLQSGMNYLESSLKLLTGYSVDKWVITESEMADYVEGLIFRGEGLRIFDKNNVRLLSDSMKTNFSLSEFISHYNNLRTVKIRDIKVMTFFSPDALDNSLRELNYNSQLSSQEFSISVLNATKTPGVASFGSRVIKNAGGYVISVANAPDVVDNTLIVTDSTDSYAVEFLKNQFNVSRVFPKKDSPLEDSSIQRADITLVIGLDFLINF